MPCEPNTARRGAAHKASVVDTVSGVLHAALGLRDLDIVTLVRRPSMPTRTFVIDLNVAENVRTITGSAPLAEGERETRDGARAGWRGPV